MINDTFCVEYIPNHSGFLLTSNADLMVKKSNHHPGKDNINLRFREASNLLAIIFLLERIYPYLKVTHSPIVMFVQLQYHRFQRSDFFLFLR